MIDLKYVNILFLLIFFLIIIMLNLLSNFPLKTQNENCIYYNKEIYCIKEK